jgi:hypothetical protein
MDEVKNELKKMVLKRIENGKAENKKTKKSRKSKKGLTLKQRRQQEKAEEEHLRAMHELNMELRKQVSTSPLYDPSGSPYKPRSPISNPSNSPPYQLSNSLQDNSPYRTNDITVAESEKRLHDARIFNELQRQNLQAKRNAVQGELADLGSLQVMFAQDAYANAQAARQAELYPVYPEQVYGKEAEKIWNEKFVYKPNAPKRPQPSVRKTKKNPRPPPSVRKTNAPRRNGPRPKPVNRKVKAPVPEVPVLKKMPAAPKPKQSRRRS